MVVFAVCRAGVSHRGPGPTSRVDRRRKSSAFVLSDYHAALPRGRNHPRGSSVSMLSHAAI